MSRCSMKSSIGFEERADVLAVESETLNVKRLSNALGADVRVLHNKATDALPMIIPCFYG
jgi:hypothetical protein